MIFIRNMPSWHIERFFRMRKTIVWMLPMKTGGLLLALVLSMLLPGGAHATVSISAALGGAGISADTAGTGGSGAWTTLGAITIIEGKKTDIGIGSTTLILKAPAGFEFNTN